MAKSKKPGFMLYFTFKPMFDFCSDERAGKLIKACFEYALNGEESDCIDYLASHDNRGEIIHDAEFDLLQGYFEVLANAIDQDAARYDEICKKRAEAGAKGGNAPRIPKPPKKAKSQKESEDDDSWDD